MLSRLFIGALWSPAWKVLTSWLLFVLYICDFVTFPCSIFGQVWYLIVLTPDLSVFLTCIDILSQVYKSYDSQIYVGVDPAIEFEYYTPIDEISVDIYTWDTKQGQCSKECGTGEFSLLLALHS